MTRIQYRPDRGPRGADHAAEGAATGPASDLPLSLESATITIQHVDTLSIQRCPLHPDTEQDSGLPGA